MSDQQTSPRYPEVEVQLTGQDGNAFAILGRVGRALRDAGFDDVTVQGYINEATEGDYDHILRTTTRWVTVS